MDEATGADAQPGEGAPALSGAEAERLSAARDRIQAAFGRVALTMTVLPRYRHLSLADLQPVLLEPLLRDRVALAQSPRETARDRAAAGAVIWASVSDEVDAKIREQIAAGVFPLRLAPEDWTSGEMHWLLDVIAPTQDMTRRLLANMKKLTKGGDLRVHPLVARLVGPDVLREMGARSTASDGGEG